MMWCTLHYNRVWDGVTVQPRKFVHRRARKSVYVCHYLKPEGYSLIRRLLTIMLAMLLWTVQTADAAVDHSKAFSGPDSGTIMLVVEQGDNGVGKVEGGLACNAGCICHVFHHACLDDLSASVVQPCVDGQAFVLADSNIGAFLTEPPTRPPLF